jgi:predicted nucleic acid-binding protein
MRTLVLDTSVAVAWYMPEVFSEAAKAWRRLLIDGKVAFLVPSLHSWELANLLRTYVVRGEIGQELARSIYSLHLDAPIETAEPERLAVLETAFQYQATVYDSVFIALSLARDVELLTAERTTTPWVVKLGDRVQTLR